MSTTDSGEYGDEEEEITTTSLTDDNKLLMIKNEKLNIYKKEEIKFYFDKYGKRWEFLTKILCPKDLELICDEYLLEKLDERSDRIRFCCKYTFDFLCPFRAVMVRRKATLFTRFEHNHSFGIENFEENNFNEKEDICSLSSCPQLTEELNNNFELNSLEDEMKHLAEQLSLIFQIYDECPIFIGNISSQFGCMISLSDKNTDILVTEFKNCLFNKEEIWSKNCGQINFLNLLREKCEQFFDVVDVTS